eukprot:2585810-Alexandrium_andersonii.AAC.1
MHALATLHALDSENLEAGPLAACKRARHGDAHSGVQQVMHVSGAEAHELRASQAHSGGVSTQPYDEQGAPITPTQ